MRKNWISIAAVAALALALGLSSLAPPAVAEDKGIIALQQSVSLLMNKVADLESNFQRSMGMLGGLVQQNTDTVNKLTSTINSIQTSMNGSSVVDAQHQSDISKQFQSLTDSFNELQAHLQKMDDTINQIHQMQQTIPAAPVSQTAAPNGLPADGSSAAANGAANGAALGANEAAPTATSPLQVYQAALTDFQASSPAAQAEMASFIRTYPNDPQVPDAMYFLGSILATKQMYDESNSEFTQLIEQYPDNAKASLAEFGKGLNLAKMGNKTAAISELHAVVKNYPGTEAARQADLELHQLSAGRGR